MGKKAPWHFWAVGIVSLLWYGSGAYVIVLAQRGMWPGMEPDEAAYYAAQPGWFAFLIDIALATSILGSLALLLRRIWALSLFGVSLVLILGNNAYDLAMGTSRAYADSAAMVVTVVIAIIAVLEVVYANAMAKRGVLA